MDDNKRGEEGYIGEDQINIYTLKLQVFIHIQYLGLPKMSQGHCFLFLIGLQESRTSTKQGGSTIYLAC